MVGMVNGYTPIFQLLNQVSAAQDAGATVAALAMVYVGIDTMAFLACPIGKTKQGRSDFKDWVEKYLQADPTSTYQYSGDDVYAARCALLHTYSSASDAHGGPNPPLMFGYADNGMQHLQDVQNKLVIISVAVLVRDFAAAVERFLRDATTDQELKRRIDSRVTNMLFTSLLK